MDAYLDELTYARRELEAGDEETKISDLVMGYFALDRSLLTESEKMHVIGLAGSTMSYDKISLVLRDIYPEGSHSRRGAHRDHDRGATKFGRSGYVADPLCRGC